MRKKQVLRFSNKQHHELVFAYAIINKLIERTTIATSCCAGEIGEMRKIVSNTLYKARTTHACQEQGATPYLIFLNHIKYNKKNTFK